METIFVTYNSGIQATFTGNDLSETWERVSTDKNASSGDYYRLSKRTLGKKILVSYFGQISTTLPL